MDKDPTLERRKAHFVFPDLGAEAGEIERVARLFSKDSEAFKLQFLEAAQTSALSDLSENEWGRLENTDSFAIIPGDWDEVARNAGQVKRDWEPLKRRMEAGASIDAPIILRMDDKLHLVSGNTRLMVARALEQTPKVLIVDLTESRQ